MKKWLKIKKFLKSQLLGRLLYYLTCLLRKSLRVVVEQDQDYKIGEQYLLAFWHGKQLMPIFEIKKRHSNCSVLVSASKDGELLAVWLKKIGYDVLRGSSRHQNVSALRGMIRKLKEGCSLGFGIDGPIGPIYRVKPGMTHMAQKFKVPIIPVGSAFIEKWVVEKAWDKYEIPKPFTKAAFYFGKPIHIDAGTDLDWSNKRLEDEIQKAELKALALLR